MTSLENWLSNRFSSQCDSLEVQSLRGADIVDVWQVKIGKSKFGLVVCLHSDWMAVNHCLPKKFQTCTISKWLPDTREICSFRFANFQRKVFQRSFDWMCDAVWHVWNVTRAKRSQVHQKLQSNWANWPLKISHQLIFAMICDHIIALMNGESETWYTQRNFGRQFVATHIFSKTKYFKC